MKTRLPGADPAPTPSKVALGTATFAGGCFWCMEPAFEALEGVVDVTSGYTGGEKPAPTYEQVCTGGTGHVEAIEVRYDPARVSYSQLLDVFWRQIDPTDPGGQFADRGTQYRTAIFYHDEEQKRLALESKRALETSGRFSRPIATVVLDAKTFYKAEDYHQDYYKKQPAHYKAYRAGSGREAYLKQRWGAQKTPEKQSSSPRASDASAGGSSLKDRLTPMQYHVTQECGTEPPFANAYWDNKKEGIYVDVVTGEPLFSSRDKFDSGTGWPSFTRPIDPTHIKTKDDPSHGMQRTEVRSAHGGGHLGHVFADGPGPSGTRYCINSAALRFVPREDLEREGYGAYKKLFK